MGCLRGEMANRLDEPLVAAHDDSGDASGHHRAGCALRLHGDHVPATALLPWRAGDGEDALRWCRHLGVTFARFRDGHLARLSLVCLACSTATTRRVINPH